MTCERCEELADENRRLKARVRTLMGPVPGPDEPLSERIAAARQKAIKHGYKREVLDAGRAYCPTAEDYAEKLEALATGPKMTDRYRNSLADAPAGRLGVNDPDDAFELFR